MEISEEQYARIKDSLPVQCGNVSLTNLQVLKRNPVRSQTGVQVAGTSKAFRPLCHRIYTRRFWGGPKWSQACFGLRAPSM